jgi:hypothetical protein
VDGGDDAAGVERVGASGELAPKLTNVRLVVVSGAAPASATVTGTDAARMAKYVATASKKSWVEMESDGQLMSELAQTGNDYGMVRVGGRVEVECYSCEGDGPVGGAPNDDPGQIPEP